VGHHELQLREVQAHPIEVHGILALAGRRRPGDARVHGDRQVELDALGVERVVDGLVRRDVEVEGRDAGEHQGVVRLEARQRAHGLHAAAGVEVHAEREAPGVLLGELQHVGRGALGVGREDGARDAGGVHLLEHLADLVVAEEVLALLEVAARHLHEIVGPAEVGHVHVHPGVDGARRHERLRAGRVQSSLKNWRYHLR
jgi:hypothetical protein